MAQTENSLGMEYLFPDATTPLTLTKVPSNNCIAIIQCAKVVDGNTKGNVAVRFTDDGSVPTANVGYELSPGDTYITTCGIDRMKFIGVAVNARINVLYQPHPTSLNRIY